MNKEVLKRLIIEEIKRFSELYKPKEGIGEQGLDELADKILSFSKDYISKDKIREKIKKAKEIKWQIPKLVIEYFEELLEEK